MKSLCLKQIACGLALIVGVAACGGGGGGNDSADNGSTPQGTTKTNAEGIFIGTTSNGRTLTGFNVNDGRYFYIYSVINDSATIGGAIQGTGTVSNGTFTSTNGRDINIQTGNIQPVNVTAAYRPKESAVGSASYPSDPNSDITFDLSYSADYELTPSLATLAGTFTGEVANPAAGIDPISLTVATSGEITGSSAGGCAFTGTVSPLSRGNGYNATITFGGAPCIRPNETVTGGAFFDAEDNSLLGVALTDARDDAFILIAQK